MVVSKGKPIYIGVATLLSGPDTPVGMEILQGASSYVQDHPKVMGHPILLVPEDVGCQPNRALQKAKEFCLSHPRPAVVIGYLCSSSTLAALQIHRQCKLPLINVSSSDPRITSRPGDWVVRLWTSRSNEAFIVARWARTIGYRNIALLYEKDAVSTSVKEAFERFLKKIYPRASAIAIEVDPAMPLSSATDQIRRSVHLIYYIGEVIDIKSAWDGLSKKILSRRWVMDGRVFIPPSATAPEAGHPGKLFRVALGLPTGNPKSPPFAFFRKRFGEPAVYTLAAYDAMDVFVQAFTKVAANDATGTRWDPRALMDGIRKVKIHGLTGKIAFDERGDRRPVWGEIQRLTKKGWRTHWRLKAR
jgi:branched-chain amino acid transport system substrate-binding protein